MTSAAYTIGNEANYDKTLADTAASGRPMRKTGKGDQGRDADYPGGWVFASIDRAAEAALDAPMLLGKDAVFAVYELELPGTWDECTYALDGVHHLLVDAVILCKVDVEAWVLGRGRGLGLAAEIAAFGYTPSPGRRWETTDLSSASLLEALELNEWRRVDTTLEGRPLWLRIAMWLDLVRVVGFDSHNGYDHALARGLEYADHPETWHFDTMPHTDGHPWRVTLVWPKRRV